MNDHEHDDAVPQTRLADRMDLNAIAERLKLPRDEVGEWPARYKATPRPFPRPYKGTYRWSEVEQWLDRRNMTVEEIADERGMSPHTIAFHRGNDAAFPPQTGRRAQGRGRPQAVYDAAAIVLFYADKAHASAGRAVSGVDRILHRGDPDERVGWKTIAARLNVSYNTVRSFPALYRDTDNPFPLKGDDGKHRWGDVYKWNENRRGSGRRGPHTDTGAKDTRSPAQRRARRPEGFAPDEQVTDATIAERFGVGLATVSTWRSKYASAAVPFPPLDRANRTCLWGDVVAWDDWRHGAVGEREG
ncbi:hypothetical protein [Nonomuraea diastatica]|uniref:Uncharacterized protein n=1 Tax=Nonomuraea diastatica TaxID=1848329 RepID=A0A4R4WHV4_9ACTN|nr:hypothetical protein [Nonomuraea diastatica]TDD13160.1 hypothetical protein E1294_42040 [Nonomuraea diastatica]